MIDLCRKVVKYNTIGQKSKLGCTRLRLRASVKNLSYHKALVCRHVLARLVTARSGICDDEVARALVYNTLIKGNHIGVY